MGHITSYTGAVRDTIRKEMLLEEFEHVLDNSLGMLIGLIAGAVIDDLILQDHLEANTWASGAVSFTVLAGSTYIGRYYNAQKISNIVETALAILGL